MHAVSITHDFHRIFQIPKLGTKLKQDAIPLSYTPRKMITHPANGYLYLIEGDHRVLGEDAAKAKLAEIVRELSALPYALLIILVAAERRED